MAQTQIEALRDAFVRTANIVSKLSDNATYRLRSAILSGRQVKEAFFSLKTIEVTEDIYPAGYGGRNLESTLRIGYTTSAGWGRHGEGGYNFIMLHEAIHNSKIGRAIVQQNFDRHQDAVKAGTFTGAYGDGSPNFERQEAMTNLLTKQLGDQIGININSSAPEAPGYPTYGYYSGSEFEAD